MKNLRSSLVQTPASSGAKFTAASGYSGHCQADAPKSPTTETPLLLGNLLQSLSACGEKAFPSIQLELCFISTHICCLLLFWSPSQRRAWLHLLCYPLLGSERLQSDFPQPSPSRLSKTLSVSLFPHITSFRPLTTGFLPVSQKAPCSRAPKLETICQMSLVMSKGKELFLLTIWLCPHSHKGTLLIPCKSAVHQCLQIFKVRASQRAPSLHWSIGGLHSKTAGLISCCQISWSSCWPIPSACSGSSELSLAFQSINHPNLVRTS